MTHWKLVMLLLLPFMAGVHRARTWTAVMGSSLLALLMPFHPFAYMAIDVLCGALVLVRPAGLAQRGIGLLFAGMVVIDTGYLLSEQADGGYMFAWILSGLGWLQFAILATWGIHDTGASLGRILRRGKHPSPARPGILQ